MRTRILLMAMGCFAVLESEAQAADSPFREAMRVRASESALGQTPLRRAAARFTATNQAVRAALLDALELRGLTELETSGENADVSGSLFASGRNFRLEVSASGTRAHFQWKTPARAAALPPEWRPRMQELEPRAREFVRTRLASVVRIGPGEALETWNLVHQVSGVGAIGGDVKTELVASTLTFTRSIDGIPVLGPSSKVHITFSAHGDVAGFEYDWPELVLLEQEEPTAPAGELKARVRALQRSHRGGLTEHSLECGYYARETGDGSLLSPACVSSYRVERDGREMRYSDVVPLSRDLPADPDWREAARLRAK